MKTAKKIIVSATALLLVIFLLIYREYNLKKGAEIRNQNQGTTTKEDIVCADEYNPVCWEDGKTYSNKCVAEEINSVKIAYTWECRAEDTESGTWADDWEDNMGETETWSVSTWSVVAPIETPVEKPSAEYFKNLKSQCAEDTCCVSSVDIMEQSSYREATDEKCPAGYELNSLKCEWSYKWCIKSTKPSPSVSTWGTVTWWLNYFNSNFSYWFTLPSHTYFSWFWAQWWASHAVWISTSSWVTVFWDNPVKVYFFKWTILPELKDSHYWLYEDAKSWKTYLELSSNSVVIEAKPWYEGIVQSIIKSIYVK
ncbi:MAG: hypothetical protein ACD_3C00188G0003 [uncultured bacterium (gcode 4)]|uniref:Kazal-like domain-containing protein n=1 Tax=uncultured bacterium (gcode 4) TaxID=1234023 RepID=K2G0A0_9BACT|nr:MAG: hypothetical protein ACD_3C00188G0003 [uncultured bacterium (gcode 4)]